MIKVLAAIVVPPHMSVSGGARAAELLSASLAEYCEITVASMMDHSKDAFQTSRHARVRTWRPRCIPWKYLPNRYSTLFYRSDLSALVRSGHFDIVHLHNPMPALELERVANACLAAQIPYVISTHGFNEIANGESVYGFGPIRGTIWRELVVKPVSRVVQSASAIFALSPADFEVARDMGYAGKELHIVPNGVALPKPEDPAADYAVLQRLNIPAKRPDQITCMFLANHTPNKGLPVLLSAFAELQIPYLLIVGGEQRSDIEYARYVDACRPGQQIIVTGRLSDDEVAALFRRSDLFVFPTLADTFPLAVLEAMSYGVPVIASRVGGIPYQLDERCGVLVQSGDSSQLAEAVRKLAGAPKQLAAMGNHARIRATEYFNWEHAAKRAMTGYENVLRARST